MIRDLLKNHPDNSGWFCGLIKIIIIQKANHHARISRLQKLLFSKSPNPKIASTLRLHGAILDGFVRFEN